jgi:hypothetical protein
MNAQARQEKVSAHIGSLRPSTRWHMLPITLPVVALSANDDGSNVVKLSWPFQWDYISDKEPGLSSPAIHGFSLSPTFSGTESGKKGLFSIGSQGGAPTFGVTSVAGGVMLAYTRYASLHRDEMLALILHLSPSTQITPDVVAACDAQCEVDPVANNCKRYLAAKKDIPAEYIANNLDRGSLCAAGEASITKRVDDALGDDAIKRIAVRQRERGRFPLADLSLWGGGGASQFTFYELQSAATYASTTQWKGHGGAALQLSSVPLLNEEEPRALTVEVLSYLKVAYQDSNAMGMGCTASLGTVTSDTFASPSSLAQCGTSQPIGGPTLGSDLTAEAYLGWVDLEHGYGRFAVGGGMRRNFVKSLTTLSIKLPVYLNATGTAKGASGKSAALQPAEGITWLDYDGILRLVPSVHYTADPTGKMSGWGFSMGVDLLGNHNLFTRADHLVR